MSSAEIRQAFLDYFARNGHEVVPSSPLVPENDPTLLFVNAGMVQFKEVFLGRETRPYKRAVSCQRCVRAGGKHNDLENVGYTARHHTFFEMLGNFSFGDYFKREAIRYAWEFLTVELKVPAERLWITVYEEDEEAAGIWLDEIGVDPERFSRCGEKDNFWTMGATGPCGPCTEIFYDHGPEIPGGPPGSPEQEGDRYVEIWNLVFTQYDRDESGRLHPIPHPSVDTGMGLERIAAVMQGVHSNYDTDIFRHLLEALQAMLPGGAEPERKSMQVIVDHIRSAAFIVADGVIPSNEGRGYVLRRIIRRALRHGHRLGFHEPFFHRLVGPLDEKMGEAYPELRKARETVERVLKREEERFSETLDAGMKVLEEVIAGLSGEVIPGEEVFRLYDTYGFPVDLTADIARERGLTLDLEGFERAMAAQRERARAASQFSGPVGAEGAGLPEIPAGLVDPEQAFLGYETDTCSTRVTALYVDGRPVERIGAGEQALVVLRQTPFYAESGGQVGDTGTIRGPDGLFEVADTRKQDGVHLHLGRLKLGQLRVGDKVQAQVDAARRDAIRLNHTATHLLHAALRRLLGEHVLQKGSLVAPDRLRFDFSHPEPLGAGQLCEIEALVNRQIRSNTEVRVQVMPMQQAQQMGAMALFGEKYGDEVRVLAIGDFSIELCGGTHVSRTGDIGLFRITAESGVAAGIRRIEAVTGEAAVTGMQQDRARLETLAGLLRVPVEKVPERVEQLLEAGREQERTIAALKAKLSSASGSDLAARAVEIDGIRVVAARLEGADVKTLRETVDQLKNKLGTAAVILASVEEGKVRLVAGVTKDACERIPAGELVNHVAQQVGGRGGGRPDMAQAGGNDPDALPAALESVVPWLRQRLSGG